ncbi:winged helix-turn-helix transcriptional regulator [Dichotomicrobium thermohalophilum]|uniref:HxlR family transcriptional regulator n=1 Tax=Dichotomicrobium thermohalophilum TaxID=933063 RepID=A0A397PH09_9HYPH|nr:helix-turn-helix domain-containing protein [Dichotomicrobium thermohalophilum]RIA47783.1 HxlR family transcriptional regulator [Dichotomicrobium thermohalophilum]
MPQDRYRQFCPVAMAAEVLCTRWTIVLIRELVAGSTRFNDLRRGVPRMSPTLLSKRLRELEEAGIVHRRRMAEEPAHFEYELTAAGRDLGPIIEAIGMWGQKWIGTEPSLANVDPGLLMWDMRRNLDPTPMPPRHTVVAFSYTDQPEVRRYWWLIVAPGSEVDLCSIDPGFAVDLYVETDLRCMTEIWMGLTTVRAAAANDRLELIGERTLADAMQQWLGLSPFAGQRKLVD